MMKTTIKLTLLLTTLFALQPLSAAYVKQDTFLNEKPTLKSPKVMTDGVNIGYLRHGETIEVLDVVETKSGTWYETPRGFVRKRFLGYTPIQKIKKVKKPRYITQESGVPTEVIAKPMVEEVVAIPVVIETQERSEAFKKEPHVVEKEATVAPVVITTTHEVLEQKPIPKVKETSESKESAQEKKTVVKEVKVTLDKEQKTTLATLIYFLGADLKYSVLDVQKKDTTGSIVTPNAIDDAGMAFGLQAGVKYYGYVVALNYERVILDDIYMDNFYLSTDYEFDIFLKPFIGFNLGVANLTWNKDPLLHSQTKDDALSTMMYGVQAGLSYTIIKNWDIYTTLRYEKFDFTTELIASPAKAQVTHDAKTDIALGMRYFFP